MNAVHPGPNAGDGREIVQSRYIKKSDTLDDMIACAQCGFIVDLKKRATGPSQGAIPSGSATQKTGTISGPGLVTTTDYYADPVDTNSGCPLCNTMNPRATGRGYTGFERPRQSIENF